MKLLMLNMDACVPIQPKLKPLTSCCFRGSGVGRKVSESPLSLRSPSKKKDDLKSQSGSVSGQLFRA